MVQVNLADPSGQKTASASFLYRTSSKFFETNLKLSQQNCINFCSVMSSDLISIASLFNSLMPSPKEAALLKTGLQLTKFLTESYMKLISEIPSFKEGMLIELVLKTILKLHEILSAINELRLSVAVLHFGCTKRERGNNADVSRIVTDMQPFNCLSLPPDGDGPRAF